MPKNRVVPALLTAAGAIVVTSASLGLTSVSSGSGGGAVGTDAMIKTASSAAPAGVSVANGAVGVDPDTPVTLTAPSGEQIGSVTLVDQAEDAAAPGTFNAGHGTWTTSEPLRAGASYSLSAVTVDRKGETGLQTESFSTGQRAGNPLALSFVTPENGELVGIGQPVVVTFEHAIKDKAAVQAALSVASSPPQHGSWGWLSDTRVDYRPEQYWQPGTRVTVKLGLQGLDDGSGRIGTADHEFAFSVGRDQETTIDLHADKATVRRSGDVVHTFPVTGGMPGLDTWGGTYAVIDKSSTVDMNSETAGLGDIYDIPDVMWDVHLTYSGTYVHAAPWSVYAQGVTNVSHGCVGASTANAEWFFDNTLPGDVVQVVGTPRQGSPGNGFNEWQEPWTQWVASSAQQT
jgi:lipoprotein-anchoring transpeptidase ErfK/SrfK